MKTDRATETAKQAEVSKSAVERLVMCNYCKHIGEVPAAHEFETSTGARTFTCEQHANLALTCMKPIGRVNT